MFPSHDRKGQELVMQLLKNAPNQVVNGEIKNVGG
jgi:hypothetical protein